MIGGKGGRGQAKENIVAKQAPTRTTHALFQRKMRLWALYGMVVIHDVGVAATGTPTNERWCVPTTDRVVGGD